ncbi:MAG: AAA domain-containing protein [Candidatus Latescibacteria bacterium]|nr:AAA domain-containing protein [Candidatus Latescibacterota bacterium]
MSDILGQSRAIEDLRHQIGQLQEVDSPVLILGESGAGKDLVARAIHAGSHRSAQQMLIIECTSVPRELMESELFGHRRGAFTGASQDRQGLFEAADGGTLFLNEIGDLPSELQGKLLQAIEYQEFRRVGESTTRKVNVRIVSATNRDLEEMVASGEFRQDLYYRLKVATLTVPPLRLRKEDILLLAEHFLRANLEKRERPYSGFTSAAVGFLLSYPWPGNVRELKNAIEGACIYLQPGQPIDAEDLQRIADRERTLEPPSTAYHGKKGLRPYKEEAEKQLLEEALERSGWVVSRAAKTLGISRQHLHNRINRYGLIRPTPGRGVPRQAREEP